MSHYELKYVWDDKVQGCPPVEVTVKFDVDLNIHELAENIKSFLLACGWQPGVIIKAFVFEDE
jgi:hypothetical protein